MNYPDYELMQDYAHIGEQISDYMQAIFSEAGSEENLASLQRRIYKDTEAGISVSFDLDDYAVIRPRDERGSDPTLVSRVRLIGFSSIVEGSDLEIPIQWLRLLDYDTPEEAVKEFNRLVQDTDNKACQAWGDQPKELSPWIVVEGHCTTRVIAGTDPDVVANRVAFIEKTPRVRIAPYSNELSFLADGVNWASGPKGSGGGDPEVDKTYGFDPDSRQWCDEQLSLLGYTLN